MKMFLVFIVLISLIGCDTADKAMNDNSDLLIDALIIGSAESPDPVLMKVEALEKNGIVKDVVILESFPVQIHLKATKEVIDELNSIPRVGSQLR